MNKVFFFILFMSSTSFAETNYKGLFFINSYTPKYEFSPKDWKQELAQVWLSANSEFSDNFSFDGTLDFMAQGQAISPSKKDFNLDLREAYFEKKYSSFRFKFGRIFIPWGNGDGFNPTDVLGAWDQNRLSTDQETQRLASDSLALEYLPEKTTVLCRNWVKIKARNGKANGKKCREKEVSVSKKNWKATVIWTPLFTKGKWLLNPSWLGPQVSLKEHDQNTVKLEDSETALRWRYEGNGWDLSLMGFYGFQHFPHYSLVSSSILSPTSVELILRPTYIRHNVLGLEYSTTWSDYIFTFESAYKQTIPPQENDRTLSPPHLEAIMGFERGFFEHYRFKFQFFGKEYSQWRYSETSVNPITEALVEINARLFGFKHRSQVGISGFVNYENEDSGFKVELFAQNNSTTQEGLAQLTLSKQWTDNLETSLGTIEIFGDPASDSYALRGLSNYFIELKSWF